MIIFGTSTIYNINNDIQYKLKLYADDGKLI